MGGEKGGSQVINHRCIRKHDEVTSDGEHGQLVCRIVGFIFFIWSNGSSISSSFVVDCMHDCDVLCSGGVH